MKRRINNMKKRLTAFIMAVFMIVGMLPTSAFAADNPFLATANGQSLTAESSDEINGVPSYLLIVPADTQEVYFTFEGEKQWCYYDSNGQYVGSGDTSWMSSETHTIAVGDSNGDGELDGVSVQEPEMYFTEYYIFFQYGNAKEEVMAPFISIKNGENEIATENIEYKGIFELGDYEADATDDPDYYDYVHEVPYYQVTVPCGTEYVDITYSEDTNIMNYGSSAYGYATDIELDAMSSATVKGKSFTGGYTENEDGTQTVKTPVKGYTLDENGNGHAITLESDDGIEGYPAVCLFAFKYDGINHAYDKGVVTKAAECEKDGEKTFTCSCGDTYTEPITAIGHSYDEGVCSVCGQEDPDFVVPGPVIPEGAPFSAITTDKGDCTIIEQKDNISYTGYQTYDDIPYYHVTIPAGATNVYVTHPFEEDPFADASYGSAYGYYAETEGFTGGSMTYDFEEVENGYKIVIPVQSSSYDWMTGEEHVLSFIADEDGYVTHAAAVERNSFDPICFFSFEYGEATESEHIHSYDEGVITTKPSCTEKGVKTFTCSSCDEGVEGHSYTEEISATGHKYDGGVVTTPATCVTDGVKTFTCINGCKAETEWHTKTEKINKTGHSYDDGEVVTEPTCTEEGEKVYTCKNAGCNDETAGHTKKEALPVIEHSYGDDRTCDNCGFTDNSPIKDENGVYQIGTAGEMLWFAEAVNGGQLSLSAVLTADIDLSEIENWPGIGNYSNRFAGSFDGQNHTIKLNDSTWGVIGFAQGKSGAHVQIKNIVTEGSVKLSAIAHNIIYTDIDNCVNKAYVKGNENSYVAGIVGEVNSGGWQGNSAANIRNCGNEGKVSGDSYVAGILGYSQTRTIVDSCYNTGEICGSEITGGIVGFLQEYKGTCEVRNCYNLGKVMGNSKTAGIVGELYNGAGIVNCYNAGEATYAIAGAIYNNSIDISNTYYRGELSTYSVPNVIKDGNFYTKNRGVSKTSEEMSSNEFATLLGVAFKQSCPYPVLEKQTSCAHTIENNICVVCKMGNGMKEEYDVAFQAQEGSVIVGDTSYKEGNDYTFSVNILEGYYVDEENFGVYVDGVKAEANNGVYTIEKPNGPFYITVKGVKKLEGVVTISLPGTGEGYRVNPCEGYENIVESGKEYKFNVTFVNGFKAGEDFVVKANGTPINPDENGVYTIENVLVKQVVTVEGVDIIPCEDTVRVNFAVTKGHNDFLFSDETSEIIMDKQIEIPYFDIELYDLERYYYNPYCYVDENGNVKGQQKAGDRESAYGVVTSMHAFIYFTEVYHLGYDEAVAGKGLSHIADTDKDGISDFDEAISWTQGAGSSFMNLWGLGSNLNYHINYEYPIAYPKWGSTSDQQALKDDDLLIVHIITGSANGSAFGLFVVNDENGVYDRTDIRDSFTVKQGDTFKLTHYLADQGENYTTSFKIGANKELYWVAEGDEVSNITEWNREDFGKMSAEEFKTDENGVITIDTKGLAPGTYYIGAKGGFAQGSGKPGSDGFVSSGSESGPSYFKLIVEEGEKPPVVMGDVNGDNEIDSTDAALINSYYYNEIEFSEQQMESADVNHDGEIDSIDASLIIALYYGNIESFE